MVCDREVWCVKRLGSFVKNGQESVVHQLVRASLAGSQPHVDLFHVLFLDTSRDGKVKAPRYLFFLLLMSACQGSGAAARGGSGRAPHTRQAVLR